MKDIDEMSPQDRYKVKVRKGCTPEDFARVSADQDYRCAICREPKQHQLRADTFRRDGKLALVCLQCFRVLEVLANAGDKFIAYLEASRSSK